MKHSDKVKLEWLRLIEINGRKCCPKCKVEAEFIRHMIFSQDRYRKGNEIDIFICPSCKYEFSETTIYRD